MLFFAIVHYSAVVSVFGGYISNEVCSIVDGDFIRIEVLLSKVDGERYY
jgi:hypothetical protein